MGVRESHLSLSLGDKASGRNCPADEGPVEVLIPLNPKP